MNPDESQSSQGGGEPQSFSPLRSRSSITPPRVATTVAQREAATNLIRSSIDQLFDGKPAATPVNEPAAAVAASPVAAQPVAAPANTNPYLRTLDNNAVPPEDEQWKNYHSAWQTYYQKYYEAYYTHHLKKVADKQPAAEPAGKPEGYFSNQPTTEVSDEEVMSKDEALFDLRQKLLNRVTESAKKVRRSRHFVPIAAGVFIILVFVFIQYNSFFIGTVAAYVSPGSVDVQNIVVDPSTDVAVGPQPLIIIPKINVDVPVDYSAGNDYNSQMAAMKNGLAHFGIPGADSVPGEVGNTVVAGHSSNDLFDTGDYKFIFAQLDKLGPGDTVYANYNSVRYTYVVTKVQVVTPDDVSALVYPTDKPILTLLTCTPLGTSKNRLLVIAEQVSPDPTSAAKAADTSSTTSTLSGANAPTLFEKLFGAGG